MEKEKPRIYPSAGALPKGVRRMDAFENALLELFFIEHPTISKRHPEAATRSAEFARASKVKSVWAYLPWAHTAVRIPDEATYFRLRTARNRDLITEVEQCAYRECVVGVAGLSVGSAAVAVLAATGGPKHMKIADPDTIEITNLNRIRATLLNVGGNKAVVAARGAWELDPFAKLEVWEKGITASTLDRFVAGLDVFVDEMDDIAMKVACRKACKKARVPVVMATDNGDSVILDVERFDTESMRPIFHGRVNLPGGSLANLSREAFVALANEIIDPTQFTDRQRDSIQAIGTTLSGVAQLGTAATIAGAALAFVVRRIASGAPMPSGRYSMGCEPAFVPGYMSARAKARRVAHAKRFMRATAPSASRGKKRA